MSQVEAVQSAGKVIKISDILHLLKGEGKTRKEINAIYGETDAAMKAAVWSHPSLLGLKVVKKPNITLVDDTTEAVGNLATNEDVIVPISAPAVTEELEQVSTSEVENNVVEEAAETTIEQVQNTAPATERGTW